MDLPADDTRGADRRPTPPPAGRGRSVATILCLVTFSNYAPCAIIVLAPRLLSHFGITTVGQIIPFISGMIASLPALLILGPLSDRYGAMRILRIAFVGLGLAYALCAIGQGLVLFVTGLALIGFFGVGVALCVPAYLVRLYPASQRKALSVALTVFAVPAVIVPGAVDRLVTMLPEQFPLVLHLPFAAVACVLLAGQFLLARAPSDVDPTHLFNLREGLRQLFQPTILVIALLAILHGASDSTFCCWFPMYMRRHFGETPLLPGEVLGLAALAYVIARVLLAMMPEGFARRFMLRAPGIMGGSILLVCLWSNSPLLLCIGYPVASFVWAAEYPAAVAEASTRVPSYFTSFLAAKMIVSQFCTAGLIALTGVMMSIFGVGEVAGTFLGGAAPPWLPDTRAAMTLPPLGFILFGVIACIAGLGKPQSKAPQSSDPDAESSQSSEGVE